jgi:hypothetical protein
MHIQSACAPLRHDSSESFRGWARQDSNLGPRDYESPALTAELQARMIVEVKHSKPLVTNPESISAAGRWDRAVVLARCSRVKVACSMPKTSWRFSASDL